MRRFYIFLFLLALIAMPAWPIHAAGPYEHPVHRHYEKMEHAPASQTSAEVAKKSAGCQSCHTDTDNASMHDNPAVMLGCTDCHGGDATVFLPKGYMPGTPQYLAYLEKSHVLPMYPKAWHWPSSRNPERSYTLLNRESPQFIRFVNPGDFRVAREACGACHTPEIEATTRSLMATGAMLFGGASYNNGILPFKRYILGEAYTTQGEKRGQPASLLSPTLADGDKKEAMQKHGVIDQLFPLPAFETIPPGDIFRIFERGGRNIPHLFPEIGNPNSLGQLQRIEEPGRPDIRQSNRGPGTGLRIAVPVLNVHKTRLNDPFTWFLGTNDQPGDYRSSGCSACHVPYANDRDPRHSTIYAKFGHDGTTQTKDPTIPRDESGHPLKHAFTRAIPTSTCMNCHMHQPNMFMNTMLGYTMWDYESDAPFMWPKQQKYPTDAEKHEIMTRNPEEAAQRGLWGDIKFLKQVWDMNPKLKDTQFADYHGHGWNFRGVFKRDRKGNLLDKDGVKIANDDPKKWSKTVHLSSVHVDVGMQCVDCHFTQDSHGNGYLHGEVMAAVEIRCQDCHGTARKLPTLRTSGPAAPPGGHDLTLIRNPDGKPRFEWQGEKLIQRSATNPDLEWEMTLTKETVDPASPKFNPVSARSKLMSNRAFGDPEKQEWGTAIPDENLAHKDTEMACYTCHTSWTTSCGGCHLPIQANWKTEIHKYEGGEARNFATYNPQVARDELFQLGKHGEIKDGIIAPVRSTSALVLSSTNINRERIYIQQPPIAASGYSSQAFAPHYPHTERKTETKQCEDCHLSQNNDNNAIMAQLLLLGTNYINFVGFNAWVGTENGMDAITVTEWDEPQAVIGSYLHKYAYPDFFAQHVAKKRELQIHEPEHTGSPVNCLQLRGENVFAAMGKNGTQVFDVASIANKGISDRIITAPFSPLGHDAHIGSKNATCVALPTNQPIHPPRNQGDLMRKVNLEQPFHPIYHYMVITDAVEGLILANVDTFANGEPRDNFIKRDATWNENGVLTGARHITLAGTTAYITTPKGVAVVDLDKPLTPKLVTILPFEDARATAVQFRYLFVTTAKGLEIVDITHPDKPATVKGASVTLKDAHRVYIARSFAYVANGKEGLAIIDVTNPEKPSLYQMYNANGQINDARDVIVATTNASAFAYIADGANGLKVLQITSPESQPNFYGFNPDPKPELIAWRKTARPALALSKGLDRDRGVDESGHQMAVFGRVGSRPFNLKEMRQLFMDKNGKPWFVTNTPQMADMTNLPVDDRVPVPPLPEGVRNDRNRFDMVPLVIPQGKQDVAPVPVPVPPKPQKQGSERWRR